MRGVLGSVLHYIQYWLDQYFLKQYGHKTSVVSVNGHFQYSETRCIPRVTLKKLFAYVNLLGMKSASKFQIQPLKHLLVIYRVSLIDTELWAYPVSTILPLNVCDALMLPINKRCVYKYQCMCFVAFVHHKLRE